ncbi:MAG: UvrD-helicase domain-containing protein [Rhodothermales bacterium]|nr:UvrD-helicase domain-containing protein [Rhodothermales bacterium]MBO6779962.1 UvrD-helicase domain-containing protein [Rhodothermales bacterium]
MQLPPDEPARRVIRGEQDLRVPVLQDRSIVLDRNIVVRAGAGSGKTRSLVDRMVALVRSGVDARRLAAITFTIKAAGELRTRFGDSLRDTEGVLRDRAQETTDDNQEAWQRELEHVQAALRRLEHVFIGTVHAFCGRLLRERPFEAGITPDFRHIDPGAVMAHRRRFWSGFVARSAAKWLKRLEAVDLDPEDLFEFFSDCANNEDVPLTGLTLQPPCPDLQPACERVVAKLDEITARTQITVGEDELLKEVRALVRSLERQPLDSVTARARFLHGARRLSGRSCVLSRWGVRGSELNAYAKEIRDSIGDFVDTYVEPALAQWRDYVFFDAGQFINEAVTEYSAARRRRGEQTFDDLLWGARRMLQASPENRAHFARKFSHVLVDEFQDTDPVQAEILLYLTSENRKEKDAWKCAPAPGALFIVGDDKQSIYRFRRADVDVFHRFEQVLLDHDGVDVALTTNFRSDPRICGFVNSALSPAFRDPLQPPGQARWEDLVAYAGNGQPQEEAVLRIAIPEKTHKKRGDLVSAEAPLVAQAIAQLVRSGSLQLEGGRALSTPDEICWSDVMVLFRTATYIPRFVEALDRLDIPYAISGGKTLGKSESLRLLLDPLDAVLAQDAIAQLAFLRGPMCGVSDLDLVEFIERGGSLRMPRRAGGLVEPRPALADGLAMLDDLSRRLAARPPAAALEGWLEDHGVLAGLAVREGGAGLAGSLVRLMALVQSWDAQGLSWPEIVDELHRLESDDIEAEQLTLDALEGNAVNLMTVHQAKGLEAKVVILADPHWPNPPGNDLFVDRSGRTPVLSGQITNRRKDILAWTPNWTGLRVRDLELQQAEELRLTYVAATRAEQLLLISYQSKVDGPWSPLARGVFELPAFEGGPAPKATQPEERTIEEIEAALEEEQSILESLRHPTYAEASASEDGEQTHFFDATGESRGRTYGTLVHHLFETLVLNRHRSLDGSWIQRVAARHAADCIEASDRAQRTADALKAAEDLLNSPVWLALQDADEVHAELPYTFVASADGDEPETLHTGVIDLAWRKGDLWMVVDYKTDAIAVEDLATKHGMQVRWYAHALRLLAAAGEVQTYLWSTHHASLIPIQD